MKEFNSHEQLVYKLRQEEESIRFDDCAMDRYASNGGIVLKYRGEVVIYLQSEDIGVLRSDSDEVAFAKAEPIFKMLIDLYVAARVHGISIGAEQARKAMRKAVGL